MTKEEFIQQKEYNDDIKMAFGRLLENEGTDTRTTLYYRILTFKKTLETFETLSLSFYDYYIYLNNENVIDLSEEIEWLHQQQPFDFIFSKHHTIIKEYFKKLVTDNGYSVNSCGNIYKKIDDFPEIKEKFINKYKEVINVDNALERVGDITSKKIDVSVQKLTDIKVDEQLFETYEIDDELLNNFWSRTGGIKKGTTNVVIGSPGSGKTLHLFDLSTKIKNADILYVSAEMNRVEVVDYTRNMDFNADLLFLHDYFDHNIEDVIKSVLEKGYDIVIIDSLVETLSLMQLSYSTMTIPKLERLLMNIIKDNTKGTNGKYTSFLIVQQVTKTGNFVGGNQLKHNTSAMLHIERMSGSDKKMYFSKNRNADISNEIYFTIDDNGFKYTEELKDDEIIEI